MKILLSTDFIDSPSTVLNMSLLKNLNNIEGVSIDFFNNNYASYDVVLFMGYDPKIAEVRAANPNIKTGVIDPRPSSAVDLAGADFIMANGIEMKDYYLSFNPNIYTYYIYPYLHERLRDHVQSEKIIIGYHGNKVHLSEMHPRITSALEALAENYKVEFWAMYNIEKLGEWSVGLPDQHKVIVKHIQWSEDNYEKHMSQVDIGLMPNLIPIKNPGEIKRIASTNPQVFLEDDTDYLIRFKATSNAGRLFVFAQYGIPVVADMFPSAMQLILDEFNGFICNSPASWYYALKKLADSSDLRNSIAKRMYETFRNKASVEVQNKGLIEFIQSLPEKPQATPGSLKFTKKDIDTNDRKPWGLLKSLLYRSGSK